ncbi:MAG TPA: DUF2577 domain-containing protein [Candidatus Bathyarchaeia archaeon]|nr:DUF2577 domain-containing protein [Candidatus Bathyarchaeia archaeon]
MNGMLNLIKKAAADAVEASSPVGVFYGTIKKASPLEVEVDQRFLLSEDFLELTDATKELKFQWGAEEYIIREKLKENDRVVLVRIQGGQKYIILDRVRDA